MGFQLSSVFKVCKRPLASAMFDSACIGRYRLFSLAHIDICPQFSLQGAPVDGRFYLDRGGLEVEMAETGMSSCQAQTRRKRTGNTNALSCIEAVIGETGSPTAVKKGVLKLQKPVTFTFHLRILLGKLYAAEGCGSAPEVFWAKIRSQHAVWMNGP
jgi:hypothetical protein